jgi:hypothetical protein
VIKVKWQGIAPSTNATDTLKALSSVLLNATFFMPSREKLSRLRHGWV